MRRHLTHLVVAVAVATLAATACEPSSPVGQHDQDALARGFQLAAKAAPGSTPVGPNPMLANVTDPSKLDYAGWKSRVAALGKTRAAAKVTDGVSAPALVVDEDEPNGTVGSNDTLGTAQVATGFGTPSGSNPKARILGSLASSTVVPDPVGPSHEDDGSLPLARATGIPATHPGIVTTGTIGDGPHGRSGDATGDIDDYSLRATAGQTVVADLDATSDDLDALIAIYDAAGNFLDFSDDTDQSRDPLLRFRVPTTGTYTVSVMGFPTFQTDPFDSGSGDGAGSEGPYRITISAIATDTDVYGVMLQQGDVLGASVTGSATHMAIYGPRGVERHGSDQDASGIYPASSPLPGGGNAVLDHVAHATGMHYLLVDGGIGQYDITVEVYRPPLESERPLQTIFLDFDGARLNTNIVGGPGVRTLSPLSTFLSGWGLQRSDLDALINRTVATVTENVREDMVSSGLNSRFKVRILNSRDDPDPWGQPNVSRVVVGGTIAQSGVETIGVAQSIDPGNFAQEETALLLLDSLSSPAGPDYSINSWFGAGSHKVAFTGQVLGNLASHEIGHLLGNWHLNQFDGRASLMDQGGNARLIFGVGPDRIGGTADDTDVDFTSGRFNPGEGFTGIEDTRARIVFTTTSPA